MKDEIGDRMKENYEDRTRQLLPRRTYTIIRLDGKAFHSFTKGFKRPFDHILMSAMDETAAFLCQNIQGAKLGYVQSDEISILLTDFESEQTDAWFDGNIQKMASISASMAAAFFNKTLMSLVALSENKDVLTIDLLKNGKLAFFDSRVFSIPDPTEVENYFIWRQQDATRNSVQMVAQSMYSHKELHGKNISDLHEMMFVKGSNWNDFVSGEKRGRAIVKETYRIARTNGKGEIDEATAVIRSHWIALDGDINNGTPIFTQERNFLSSRIPRLNP